MKQFCPVDARCGACQLLAAPYADQLLQKQSQIEELFQEVAAKDGTAFLPIIGMDDPFFYRNKVISPYAPGRRIKAHSHQRERNVKGKKRAQGHAGERREILCGMYARGTHRIIPTDECLLENQVAKRIVLAIRDLMPRHRIEPYDEDAGKGFLRHAIVRVGHQSKEVLVTLVTNGEAFPGAKSFCRELVKRCPDITTIVQNVNTRNTNVILGDGKERALYGPGFILDRLCGLSFRISSHSFYQVNAIQTEVLYRKAIELADLQGVEHILDAYCGTGTIGLVAARALQEKRAEKAQGKILQANASGQDPRRVQKDANADDLARNDTASTGVIGVDKVPAAIVDARNNAKHNGIENATFVAQDAGEFMNELAQREESIDVLFMDPPRAGASEEFLEATMHLRPKRIVYISCNPKTQVRDVAILQGSGYALKTVQPVDMFPHTDHIENIIVLDSVQ
jgi:23S rRNA (uracil1939-C5)-methyltransferase